MKGKRGDKVLFDGIDAFLVRYGYSPLQRRKWLYAANQLECLAGMRYADKTRLHAKRRVALAMAELKKQRDGKLSLRHERLRSSLDVSKYSPDRARSFYASAGWKRLRYLILLKYGRRCMACGSVDGVMHVDHIKPLRKFWHLRMDSDNLQVLCGDCNFGKGNRDETDWRTDRFTVSLLDGVKNGK